MRYLLASCLLLAIVLPCQAQGEKPKPNTLTAKEIADGWILLFDGETTYGWTVESSAGKGAVKIADGALDFSEMGECTIWTTSAFGAFELQFQYQSDTGDTDVGMQTTNRDHRASQVLPKQTTWTPGSMRVAKQRLYFNIPGVRKSQDMWDGSGKVILAQGPKTVTKWRNLKLKPLDTNSIFNGTDLTGWKAFLGEKYKSKFAVLDGAINVKDGPGDLQTVGKYQDFVLQLECISHGKYLNSGIFFRCRDGEYQNGYEAQIRNEFKPAATEKYLIEEYDPKTNKQIGKKEQLFAAVDYGTGAIYRRQPARKQMSKDGEWFGMTIVAHGNHLATWVNGVQVTDWIDNRKKSDNARTGCKLEAGHISIQGHDPTTNLSFKNFRIAEFK